MNRSQTRKSAKPTTRRARSDRAKGERGRSSDGPASPDKSTRSKPKKSTHARQTPTIAAHSRHNQAPNGQQKSQMAEANLPSLQAIGRKNGEWYVIKLPAVFKQASPVQILKKLPIPHKWIDKLLRDKSVTKQGDRLSLRIFPEESPEFVAQWTDLNILYEDEFTLIVNKPAGLEIYPSAKGQTGTLANCVAAYYLGTGQACRVRHIHRLDKDTTGPVLYAKNEIAHYAYDRDMREKKIQRIYLAVVEGIVVNDRGTINQPIGKDRHHSTRRRVSQTGEAAVTHYEVVERFANHTLVRLRLETGRTHQIRVHMSSLGHSLAGDGLYSGKRTWISRQALHGERLLLHHAWSGKQLSIEAPLPDDFRELIYKLRQERQM